MQPMQPTSHGENAPTGEKNPEPQDFRPEETSQWEAQQPEEPRAQPRADNPDSPRDFEARIRDLENALAASRANQATGLIPFHGAGPGTDINETWSQYEQEQAAAEAAP